MDVCTNTTKENINWESNVHCLQDLKIDLILWTDLVIYPLLLHQFWQSVNPSPHPTSFPTIPVYPSDTIFSCDSLKSVWQSINAVSIVYINWQWLHEAEVLWTFVWIVIFCVLLCSFWSPLHFWSLRWGFLSIFPTFVTFHIRTFFSALFPLC